MTVERTKSNQEYRDSMRVKY
ncbi:Protein of unknown function [Bacillus wiedmannii]|uniref:Uncharacterized protein n=1 Tax=Bacillus wiedmannii TaxID=1890302 RepID=A0A1C4FHB2_9BACI|nr:Protein of unknown function [Bacillus wiedmannii]